MVDQCLRSNKSKRVLVCTYSNATFPSTKWTSVLLRPLIVCIQCRSSTPVPYNHDLVLSTGGSQSDEWHADLLGCCSEPALCMSICLLGVRWKVNHCAHFYLQRWFYNSSVALYMIFQARVFTFV